MTNKEILSKMEVGSIITDKRILSSLKRRGLIWGYSEWGYLENCQLWHGMDFSIGYIFPFGNSPKEYSLNYESRSHIREVFGDMYEIEYMGCKFRIKYLDGCFNAYLQMVENNGNRERKKEPRMSLYGSII